MKKFFRLFAVFLVMSCSTLFLTDNFSIKAVQSIPVSGIVILKPNSQTLKIGSKLTLKCVVLPTNASKQSVVWSSSNTKIASVSSSSGTVTPISPGSVTITAKTVDGGFIDSVDLTVIYGVSSISLEKKSINLEVNEAVQLKPTIKPSNATNKNILWSSTNTSIASVDNDGNIYGISPGTTIISAVSEEDPTIVVNCVVTVPLHVSGIDIKDTNTVLKVGENVTLGTIISPSNATVKDVTWSSSNTRIAKVSSNGVVTPISSGTVTITATTVDDKTKYASKTFEVKYAVTGISIDKSTVTINKGDPPVTLTATVRPSNATNKNIVWSSSDDSIAAVNASGTVYANSPGTAIIYAKSEDNPSIVSQCIVTVPVALSGIKIKNSDTELKVGKSLQLTTSFEPTNATTKEVTWYSNDTRVAKINSYGVVTAVSEGPVTITVKAKDGGFTDSIILSVISDISSIKLDKSSVEMKKGEILTLVTTIMPSNADKSVIWKSSNTSVAKVDNTGTITAIGSGSAVITVTSLTDKTKIAKCVVNVLTPVTGLYIKDTVSSLDIGKSLTLRAVITPSNASNSNVKWQSSDTSVARVSSTGVVTAVNSGTVSIVAVSEDGGFSESKTLTIIQGVTDLTLSKSKFNLKIGESDVLLDAVVKPYNAADKRIVWKSSNTKVATVDSNGKVHPVGPGTADISAYSVQNTSVYSKCTVTVINPVTGISFTPIKDILGVGSSLSIKYNIAPSNATDKTVFWTSSNEKVAIVNERGSVKGVAPGTVKITAVTNDGSYKASVELTIINEIKSITLDKTSFSTRVGDEDVIILPFLTAKNSDYNFDNNVIWSSSNNSIATVDHSGTVHAVSPGKVVITATSLQDSSKSAKCNVVVIQPVTDVSISSSTNIVNIGGSTVLKAIIMPSDATIKSVKWSSDNVNVATVSTSGSVKGISAGNVTITATTEDGNIVASKTLTVVEPVKSISLNQSSVNMKVGDILTLTATINPNTVVNKNVIWSSNKTNVAEVSQDGIITAKSAGIATITVKSEQDPKKTFTCKIIIVN